MTSQEIILCRGFLQPERRSDGMGDLYDRLVAAQEQLPQPTHVEIFRQTADPRKVAIEIAHDRNAHSEPRILLVGHSYGGDFVNELAKCLKEFELPVYAMFLADAVGKVKPRHIAVPDNVRRVYAWRQSQGVIHGSSEIGG